MHLDGPEIHKGLSLKWFADRLEFTVHILSCWVEAILSLVTGTLYGYPLCCVWNYACLLFRLKAPAFTMRERAKEWWEAQPAGDWEHAWNTLQEVRYSLGRFWVECPKCQVVSLKLYQAADRRTEETRNAKM